MRALAALAHSFKKNANIIERGDCCAPEMDLLLQAFPFSKGAITQHPLLSLAFNTSKRRFEW